jgi:hypothetical protein
MKIGGQPVDLLVVTDAEHSVVTVGPLSKKHTSIIGATGDWAHHPFLVS